MKLKYIAFVLSLATGSHLQAAERNLCDELIDSGTSSSEHIKKCLDEKTGFGPSPYYKEQEAKKKIKEKAEKIETESTTKKKDNLEIKKFTAGELFEAGFGKPFYAIRGDYRNHRYKEKRITEGDALCSYLGYEKAIKSVVSPELWENKNGLKVHKQGLVIETGIFGGVSKMPDIYRDEDYKFTVRKYDEITCVRRKDKSLDDSEDVLKAVTEDLVMLNEELNTDKNENYSNINDDSRSDTKKKVKTPNGYTPPDWAQDAIKR